MTSIRHLTLDDLDWVVNVTRVRRELLAPHAPRFWNPAPDATARHRDFLSGLIGDPDVLSVRSESGYLIAVPREHHALVDDMVVTGSTWSTEGVDLLRHAEDRLGPLRFVVPAFESTRAAAALEVGLVPAEEWWHRDLSPPDGRVAHVEQLTALGAEGRLVHAPPIYDPGGPVLLVTGCTDRIALDAIEDRAADRGARVSVVAVAPDDERLGALVREAGYVLTTVFHE